MKIPQILKILILAAFVVTGLFILEGNVSFNLWDESFLWYGVQRVMLGEVPMRDFMAYDPGRYYWSAALMTLWGNNGIIALRISDALFQVIGLVIGLSLIARTVKKEDTFYLLLSSITLVIWMTMGFKAADYTTSIFLIGALTFLIENPTSKRYFFTGLCVGLAAFFGRNHGIYGVAGSAGVMLWLSIKRGDGPGLIKGLSLWTIGIITGFIPILFMVLMVPGFASAFWESILFLFEVKTTNLPLPIPWPWQVNFASVSLELAIHGIMVGLFFIAIVAFGVLSIIWVVWQKLQNKKVSPALVAASFLALPYAHYAYSRADVAHLGLGIFPVLVGCLVILSTQPLKIKWPLSIMLCLTSLLAVHLDHPGWNCYASKQCVNIKISGNDLVVDPGTASDVKLLRELADQYAPNDQSFVVTPFWPGAYPLLERKSPMWEIYAFFLHSPVFEQAEIERIKTAKPGFVLIFDLALDGRNDLRFKNTHPLIHQYILDHFDRLSYSPNTGYQIYIAKGTGLNKKVQHPEQNSNAGSRYFCERFFRASCSKNQQKTTRPPMPSAAPIRPRHLVSTQQGVET